MPVLVEMTSIVGPAGILRHAPRGRAATPRRTTVSSSRPVPRPRPDARGAPPARARGARPLARRRTRRRRPGGPGPGTGSLVAVARAGGRRGAGWWPDPGGPAGRRRAPRGIVPPGLELPAKRERDVRRGGSLRRRIGRSATSGGRRRSTSYADRWTGEEVRLRREHARVRVGVRAPGGAGGEVRAELVSRWEEIRGRPHVPRRARVRTRGCSSQFDGPRAPRRSG